MRDGRDGGCGVLRVVTVGQARPDNRHLRLAPVAAATFCFTTRRMFFVLDSRTFTSVELFYMVHCDAVVSIH